MFALGLHLLACFCQVSLEGHSTVEMVAILNGLDLGQARRLSQMTELSHTIRGFVGNTNVTHLSADREHGKSSNQEGYVLVCNLQL